MPMLTSENKQELYKLLLKHAVAWSIADEVPEEDSDFFEKAYADEKECARAVASFVEAL